MRRWRQVRTIALLLLFAAVSVVVLAAALGGLANSS